MMASLREKETYDAAWNISIQALTFPSAPPPRASSEDLLWSLGIILSVIFFPFEKGYALVFEELWYYLRQYLFFSFII